MFVTVITHKYALLISQGSYRHFIKPIQFYFNNTRKSSPFNSTHYVVLYPQNGDRIVTIDSVTSFHPMYTLMARIVKRIVKRLVTLLNL